MRRVQKLGALLPTETANKNRCGKISREKGSRQDTEKNFQSWGFRNSSTESWFSYRRTFAGRLKHADCRSHARIHDLAPGCTKPSMGCVTNCCRQMRRMDAADGRSKLCYLGSTD